MTRDNNHHWTYKARTFRNAHQNNYTNPVDAIRINGWAVRDHTPSGPNSPLAGSPGVYLEFWFNEKHAVTVSIGEQDLLEILAEIQDLKRDWGITKSANRRTV